MLHRRHDLLRIDPPAWDAMLQGHPGLADVPMVVDWARLGRPVIVRRHSAGDDLNAVPAALPLPPSHGKRRIAISLPPDAVLAAVPPVKLRDAAPMADTAWQTVIAALVALGEAADTGPFVFGALLWEHVTGLPYLTSRSDLDLLWPVADELSAVSLVQDLLRLDARGPVRIDGELVLPDGAGVNWRELALANGHTADVLAKAMDGTELRPRAGLFRTLAQAQ